MNNGDIENISQIPCGKHYLYLNNSLRQLTTRNISRNKKRFHVILFPNSAVITPVKIARLIHYLIHVFHSTFTQINNIYLFLWT